MANPVRGYLEQTDFENKTVAPFWTYITNQGKTKNDFLKKIQNGIVVDGLPLSNANSIDDNELDSILKKWSDNISPQR